MNDIIDNFEIESACSRTKKALFLCEVILWLLIVLFTLTGLKICQLIAFSAFGLLVPFTNYGLRFMFRKERVEIRIARSEAMNRILSELSERLFGEEKKQNNRRKKWQRRSYRPGWKIKSFRRERIKHISYRKKGCSYDFLIELEGCKPRKQMQFWVYRLINLGKLYVIRRDSDETDCGEFIRFLETYADQRFNLETAP